MKKFCALLLSLVMLLSLAACGGSTSTSGDKTSGEKTDTVADTKPVKIKVGTPAAEGNPMQGLIYYWQEKVDEKVPGMVEWENYPNSTIGSEREMVEMVFDGTLDCAMVGPSNITAVSPMNAVRLQDMPFVFQDQDELYAATNEWMRDKINEECEAVGVNCMWYIYLMGQEIENNRNPIYTPDDVKGMKIRVYNSPGPYNFLEACGGLPVSMAISEVYTGVQQGAIDGLYTTTSNFVPQKFVEVCKYHTKLTITNLGMTIMFNQDILESYPQEVQDALMEAGMEVEEYTQTTLMPQVKASTYDEIAAAGVEINEVTEEQYQAFVDLVADYCYEDLRQEVGPELWDFCMDWIEEYRAR